MENNFAWQSENLSRQTDGLISQVGALVNIADEQKKFAVKMERQTTVIRFLTWVIAFFTVALLASSLVTIKIMLKEDAKTNVQNIEASQPQEDFRTNKQVPVLNGHKP